jgi:hypothetical protein
LNVRKAALSKSSSTIKERVPNYQFESLGIILLDHAAAETRTGRPRGAEPGESFALASSGDII